jgi:hypothetical protein
LANLSGQQVAQGQAATQGLNNATQNEQNILQNANSAYNNAQVGMQSNINNVNSQTAIGNQNTNTGIVGGLLGGVGSALGLAKGGTVKKMASGGGVSAAPINGPQSGLGQWITSSSNSSGPSIQATPSAPSAPQGTNPLTSGLTSLGKSFAAKPVTPQAPSPSANDLGIDNDSLDADVQDANAGVAGSSAVGPAASDVPEALTAGVMGAYKGGLMTKGGNVSAKGKGQQATVPGDSLKNDKIPTMLSAGEEVIDRETLADPGPIGTMARAVAAHINAKNKKGKK